MRYFINVKSIEVTEAEKIRKFDFDIENELNCENCPHNNDFKGDVYPCGQYHCWVTVSCNRPE